MAEPDAALFPLPYQEAEQPYVGPSVQPVDLPFSEAIDYIFASSPLLGALVLLMLYTRVVQGKPVNPLKWIGWKQRSTRSTKSK